MGHIELATPIAHIWYTRRSPSYLGLLLNISQRNLDRVLYYAQYIVTSVDEAARKRALQRMDEEVQSAVDSQSQELLAELASIEAELAERATAAATRQEDGALAIQQRRDEASPAPDKVVFTPSDSLILPAGEIVSREAISTLNQVVQDELSRVEEPVQAKR